MSQFDTLLLDTQNNVATITLNRPERRNAMNTTLNQELTTAFTQVGEDETIRAVLITGAGKGFCAGADLTAFSQMPIPDEIYEAVVTSYQPMMAQLVMMKKPVVAAVNGVAAGAGMALALACDLRLMADDASLMMAYSNIAFVPDAGASWFLARLVGYSRAYELAIEGERIPADRCLALGLTNKVVPAASLRVEAQAWTERLAKRPTLALGLTKHTLHHALLNDLASTIEYEAQLQKQTAVSQDHREGVMAFIQKREPNFTGK